MKKIKYACLFSGIGAPLQGAYRVYGKENIEHIFSCEYDKFARQSFNANYEIHPDHFHNDVREMDGTQYQGKVDILIGGSPCQAFSIAGLRNGTDNERGQLIYQYIRIVDEVKAPVIVYENVKGMLSISGGNTIKEFVQVLRDIGYFCHYEVVNTKDYGVPQNRERIFLVGFLDHEMYHRFQFAPKQKLEKRLKDVLESEVDEKYYLNKPFELYSQQSQGNTLIDIESECNTLIAGTHGYAQGYINDMNRINRTLRIGGGSSTSDKHCFDLVGVEGGNQEPKILQLGRGFNKGGEHSECPTITKNSFECNNFVKETGPHDLSPKIGAMRGRNPQNPKSRSVGLETEQMLEINENGTSNCLTSVQKDNYVVTSRIRKLTPRECLRLQDFPDSFIQVCSDSQQYKQAGNSMSVNVLEMIFRQIEKAKEVDKGRLF